MRKLFGLVWWDVRRQGIGMSLAAVTILIGVLALLMAGMGLVRPDLLRGAVRAFPRSRNAGWILAAICCVLAVREAWLMNMGGLNGFKQFIFVLAPLVFVGCVTCLKELLAARALGGLLCLVAVPLTQLAVFSGRPYFQVISLLAYSWVIVGIMLLMAPWRFRQMHAVVLENERVYFGALAVKAVVGLGLVLLGMLVY
jgi:hypothetical protein